MSHTSFMDEKDLMVLTEHEWLTLLVEGRKIIFENGEEYCGDAFKTGMTGRLLYKNCCGINRLTPTEFLNTDLYNAVDIMQKLTEYNPLSFYAVVFHPNFLNDVVIQDDFVPKNKYEQMFEHEIGMIGGIHCLMFDHKQLLLDEYGGQSILIECNQLQTKRAFIDHSNSKKSPFPHVINRLIMHYTYYGNRKY